MTISDGWKCDYGRRRIYFGRKIVFYDDSVVFFFCILLQSLCDVSVYSLNDIFRIDVSNSVS